MTIYAQNNSRLEDISRFLAEQGITSRNGKALKRDRISFTLSNPFYVGFFRYSKKLYEGKHEPTVSKKIFDQVQEILHQRGRPHHKTKNEPQAFCGLLKCGTCSMGITGEYKLKKQKNGNTHEYIYYHCTRKNKAVKCTELCIRQERLDEQISCLLEKFTLKPNWAEQLLQMLETEKAMSSQSFAVFVQEAQNSIKSINTKLQRLLDSYLEQDIEREIYLKKKAEFMLEKKSLEEQIVNLEQKRFVWVEPMQKWIKQAENLPEIAKGDNLFTKKVAIREIFGSNLFLSAKQAAEGTPKSSPKGLQSGGKWPEMHWCYLRSANQNINQISESVVVVALPGIEPGFCG